jgi:hypothetical protein
MVRHGIDLQSHEIQDLCKRHGIKELWVFGSILRPDFRPDSDVDFVVTLPNRHQISMRELFGIEDELARAVGRTVDVILGSELEGPDANPYRRQEIVSTMERIYAG